MHANSSLCLAELTQEEKKIESFLLRVMVVVFVTDSFTLEAARSTCYITVPWNISKNTSPCLPKLFAKIVLPVMLRKDT